MAKISEEVRNRFDEYTQTYPSAIFVPIPKSDPILILKEDVTSFWLIVALRFEKDEKGRIVRSEDCSCHFVAFWRGVFYKDDLPDIFIKYYGSRLFKLMDNPRYQGGNDLPYPKGIFEIPLDAIFVRGMFQINKEQFQEAKDALRKFGLIEENRGKFKKIASDKRFCREFLIATFKKCNKKKPLPIKYLQNKLAEEIARKYPNDQMKADKLIYHDSTIRRILRPFIKK